MRRLQCVQVHFEPDRLWSDRLGRAYEIVVRREPGDGDADRLLLVKGGRAERWGPSDHDKEERSVDDVQRERVGTRDASVKLQPAPSRHGARHAA